MKILIAGGTGFIGQNLVERFIPLGDSIIILGRNLEHIKEIYGDRVVAMDWDMFEKKGINALENIDLIINLNGAGIADKRWTTRRKKIIIDSRTIPTRLIAKICGELGTNSPPLLNASAVGIYGIQEPLSAGLPPPFTEETSIDFDHPKDFSTEVTRLWEKETHYASQRGVRVVNMRFGVVLGKNGGALPKLVKMFKVGLGGRVASGNQPFSWVSITDLCRAIEFLIKKPQIQGPVNIVSPICVTQYKLARSLAKVLKRPSFMWSSAIILEILFGEMADELLINGQHVYPKVLLDNQFEFEFPEIASALENILNKASITEPKGKQKC